MDPRKVALLTVVGLAVLGVVGGPAGAHTDTNDTHRENETAMVTVLIHGTTATDLAIVESARKLEAAIASELDVSDSLVTVSSDGESVTVGTDDVNTSEIRDALDTVGLDGQQATVRDGVTAEVATESQSVLQKRIADDDSDGTVDLRAGNGEHYLILSSDELTKDQLRALATDPVTVEIVAESPEVGTETVISHQNLTNVSPAQSGRAGRPPFVTVTLNDDAAMQFTDALVDHGFIEEGVNACRYQDDPTSPGYCLYTVVDGEIVSAASLSGELAYTIENGNFVPDPRFRILSENMTRAEEISLALRSGPLPAKLSAIQDRPEDLKPPSAAADNSASDGGNDGSTGSIGPGFGITAVGTALVSLWIVGRLRRSGSG